jgi:hypothetical protein
MPRASQDRITAVRLEIAAAASKLQGRRTAQLVGRIRKKAVGPLVDLLQYGIKLASTSSKLSEVILLGPYAISA